MLETSRRTLIAGAAALTVMPAWARNIDTDADALLGANALRAWWALDLASGRTMGDNPDLQLPMCSSCKWLVAAMLLWRADRGTADLDRQIHYGTTDLVYNSPVVKAALERAGGMQAALSIRDLCEATVTTSDSAALNLLLRDVGGPSAVTAWLRRIGDPVTRLDRYELDLNRVPPGDPRDTSTPRAMVGNLRHLLFGKGLKPASRALMLDWLLQAKPGNTRMPAGLRPGWRIGHKTGTWMVDPGHAPSERSASIDIAVLLPDRGKPVLLAGFTAGSERPQAHVDSWFAELVKRATSPTWLGRT